MLLLVIGLVLFVSELTCRGSLLADSRGVSLFWPSGPARALFREHTRRAPVSLRLELSVEPARGCCVAREKRGCR